MVPAQPQHPPDPVDAHLGPKISPIPSLVRWNGLGIQKAKTWIRVRPKSRQSITTLTGFTRSKNSPSVSGSWPSVPMAMILSRPPWSLKFRSPIPWACWRFPSRKPEVKSQVATRSSAGSQIPIFNFSSNHRSCCLMSDTLSSNHRHRRRHLRPLLLTCRMIQKTGASTRWSAICPIWIQLWLVTFSCSKVTKSTGMPSCCWPQKWWWSTWIWSSVRPWKSPTSSTWSRGKNISPFPNEAYVAVWPSGYFERPNIPTFLFLLLSSVSSKEGSVTIVKWEMAFVFIFIMVHWNPLSKRFILEKINASLWSAKR